MNNKGQQDIEKIIGGILAFFFLIIFISAMIPLFNSIGGQDDLRNEINNLKNKVSELEQEINNKNVEISQLQSLLESVNSTIGEKDSRISNLTGQLTEKEKEIENLTEELSNYKEREYLPSISNNYYNILNYVEKIENKFYTINIAIGIISVTLLGIVIKLFGLDVSLKIFFRKLKKNNKLPKFDKENE